MQYRKVTQVLIKGSRGALTQLWLAFPDQCTQPFQNYSSVRTVRFI